MFLLIQEKSDVEAKLTEKDEALKGLQVILMKMTGEKDELAGENRTLKEQMELYKVCFSGTCINGLSSKKNQCFYALKECFKKIKWNVHFLNQ